MLEQIAQTSRVYNSNSTTIHNYSSSNSDNENNDSNSSRDNDSSYSNSDRHGDSSYNNSNNKFKDERIEKQTQNVLFKRLEK